MVVIALHPSSANVQCTDPRLICSHKNSGDINTPRLCWFISAVTFIKGSIKIFFFLFLILFFFLSWVDMLNPRVCRFVVNQKEKYWANHSWRWASGESMEASLVSGGLRDGSHAERKTIQEIKEGKEKSGSNPQFHFTYKWKIRWIMKQ